jgi:hypothetical protein
MLYAGTLPAAAESLEANPVPGYVAPPVTLVAPHHDAGKSAAPAAPEAGAATNPETQGLLTRASDAQKDEAVERDNELRCRGGFSREELASVMEQNRQDYLRAADARDVTIKTEDWTDTVDAEQRLLLAQERHGYLTHTTFCRLDSRDLAHDPAMFHDKAVLYFQDKANTGATNAQYVLAHLLLHGMMPGQKPFDGPGPPPDARDVLAYRWFAISAIRGNVFAREWRDRLAPTLDEHERRRADQLAKNWEPKRPTPPAPKPSPAPKPKTPPAAKTPPTKTPAKPQPPAKSSYPAKSTSGGSPHPPPAPAPTPAATTPNQPQGQAQGQTQGQNQGQAQQTQTEQQQAPENADPCYEFKYANSAAYASCETRMNASPSVDPWH